MKLQLILTALSVSSSVVLAASAYQKDRTLVIVDEGTNESKYDGFLKDLESRGFELDIENVKSDEFDLQVDGENEYDNLLILPTKAKSLGSKLNAQRLLKFFDKGGNILAITNSASSPESLREFLNELEISISPRGYKAVDHFNYNKDQGGVKHDVINAKAIEGNSVVSSDLQFLYKGGAAYLGNSNPHVVPIAHGSKTSYAYEVNDDSLALTTPWVSGSQTYLLAGFQGNNNARVAWSGSSALFSNEYFELADSNREVARQVSQWAFQEKGILKIEYAEHEPVSESREWSTTSSHALYHVREIVSYTAAISEWDGESWKPYVADDLQMEFVMLDPYYRLNLGKPVKETETAAVYNVSFEVPDQHGIFTFKLDYFRSGKSFLQDHQTVTVRHRANDEWPRSWEITNSWVYLSSFVTVVACWLVFVVLYLYTSKGGKQSTVLKEKKSM